MRIALALGLCLIACAATAAPRAKVDAKPQAETPAPPSAQSLREAYRARVNENVVTIMAGSPNGTDLGIAYDIAQVVDDGDNLRVLPIVGKGAAQSVKDVMFLKGVDMGITQANIIKYFARTGELGSNFIDQITYVAKLFTEEVHIITRSNVTNCRNCLKTMLSSMTPWIRAASSTLIVPSRFTRTMSAGFSAPTTAAI